MAKIQADIIFTRIGLISHLGKHLLALFAQNLRKPVNKGARRGVLFTGQSMSDHTKPDDGTANAMKPCMNAALQARVRSLLAREFYRRGLLTWDMKMALRRALAPQ